MRNLKKALVLVLTLAMVLGVMVVGAGAAFNDQSEIDTKHQDAVEMAGALNIINGYPDGSFKPNGNVTREEMAKMICILDNGGKEPQLATGNTFKDVAPDRWSNKYIESCASRGVVAGMGDGTFNPTGNVTASQAAKMLLVELGYKEDLAKYTGAGWDTRVNVDATKNGYYDDLEDIDVNAALSREHAAQMIWNALQANEVEYSSVLSTDENGQLTSTPKVSEKMVTGGGGVPSYLTLMADKYGLNDKHHGIMTSFVYNETKGEWNYYITDEATPAYNGPYKSTTDYTDLYQQDITVVFKEKNSAVDSVYGMFADKDNGQVLVSGVIGDIDKLSADTNKIKVDGTSYDLAGNASTVDVFYFQHSDNTADGKLYANAIQSGVTGLDAFKFVAIDDDSNDKIDRVVVYPFLVGQINLVNATKVGVNKLDSSSVATALIPTGGTTGSLEKDKIDLYDGAAKDDFVVYTPADYTATNTASIVKADTVLEGKASRVSGSGVSGDDITIDGTAYTNYCTTAIAAGSDVEDTVVVNGYIFTTSVSSSADKDAYAVVMKLDSNINGPQAKLLLKDGSKKVVDLKTAYTGNEGDLVTYTTNSDNEYTLTPADITTDANTGYDKIIVGTTINATDPISTSNVSDKDGSSTSSKSINYIGGSNIASDATIFVINGTDYKVITGDQLKKTAVDQVKVAAAYASSNSKTGYDTVELAYVTATTLTEGDTQYGYILKNAATVRNDDDTATVYELQMWNGTEIVTLKTSTGTLNDLKAGLTVSDLGKQHVIAYQVNSDNEISKITEAKSAATGSTDVAALTSASGKDLSFNGNSTTIYKLTDDSVILYVDNDKVEGMSAFDFQLAQVSATDSSGNPTAWYSNVLYKANSANEIEFMVVDYNNDILNALS